MEKKLSPRAFINILLIDQQVIFLKGLATLISTDKRFHVCGTASNTAEAVKLVTSSAPDVIFFDIDMENGGGLELLDIMLKKSKARIAILTASQNAQLLDRAIFKGARGIISKSVAPELLLKSIEKICSGEIWLSQAITSRIFAHITTNNAVIEKSPEELKLELLTPKEELITKSLQQHSDKTLKDVSSTLNISEHTLRNHLASIYEKIGVRNRMELYVFCVKHQKTVDPKDHPHRRATDI
jgi:two-component system nitrate/nitrite response regulator NarL